MTQRCDLDIAWGKINQLLSTSLKFITNSFDRKEELKSFQLTRYQKYHSITETIIDHSDISSTIATYDALWWDRLVEKMSKF